MRRPRSAGVVDIVYDSQGCETDSCRVRGTVMSDDGVHPRRSLFFRGAGKIYRVGRQLPQSLLVFGVLRPAARFLPRTAQDRLPRIIAWFAVLSPRGRRAAREFARAFPDGPHDPKMVTRRWLALRYADYLFIRRVIERGVGELPPATGRVEMSEETAVLLESGQSVMFGTGHFCRMAMASSFYREGVIPRRLNTIVAPLEVIPTAWEREMFGQLLEAIPVLRSDSLSCVQGRPGMVKQLIQDVSTSPGWGPNVHVDAPIPGDPRGSFRRAFAGTPERTFATGTARIARMAQIPIVLFVAYLDESGEVVLWLSDPVPPPDPRDEESDVRLTSLLLDELERAVGKRPSQYALGVGEGRSWDPTTQRWIDRTDAAT